MALAWAANLAVGVDEIDLQHKELFLRLNALLQAMREGRGRDEIARTLGFLEQYVVVHFTAEDKLMAKHGYPAQAAQAHRKQHAEFIQVFKGLKSEFQATGPSSMLILKLQQGVCDWLLAHIGKTDLELGTFLRAQRGAQRAP